MREKDAKVRLYVSNIPYDIRWQDLKDVFREKGTFHLFLVSFVVDVLYGGCCVLFELIVNIHNADYLKFGVP